MPLPCIPPAAGRRPLGRRCPLCRVAELGARQRVPAAGRRRRSPVCPIGSTSTSTSSRSCRTAASSATVRTTAQRKGGLRLDVQASALADAGVGPSRRRAGQHVQERAGPPHHQHRPQGDDAGGRLAPHARRGREGDADPLDRAGRRVEAALGVHPARHAGAAGGRRERLGTRRDRSVRAGRARGEGLEAVARGAARDLAAARLLRSDAACRRLRPRSTRSSPTAPPTPTSASSIACWRRRPTASAWPPTGSTSRATPTRTATRTTACARCGRGATG